MAEVIICLFKQTSHWPGLEMPVIFQQGAMACVQAAAAARTINNDNMLRHTLWLFLCNLVKKKMFMDNYGIMVERVKMETS